MDFTVKELSIKDRIKLVEEQFHMWEASGARMEAENDPRAVRFITISREYGCAGFRIGDRLAGVLNGLRPLTAGNPPWTVYDQKLVALVCEDYKLDHTLVESLNQHKNVIGDSITAIFTGEPSSLKVFKKCAHTIFKLAAAGRVILIGRAAAQITHKLTGGLHVRIVAPLEWRVKQVAAYEKIESIHEAQKYVQKQDQERGKYVKDIMGHSVSETTHYDMVLNQERLGVEKIVKLILRAMELKHYEPEE